MFKRIISAVIIFTLVFEQSGFAQVAPQMGIPAYINGYIAPDRFRPVQLRSISFTEGPGEFNLYLDKGDVKSFGKQQASDAAQEFMRYFKTGLSLPNNTFWVNLRPDDPSRIIDPALDKTDIGRILLAADLQLKKDLARFTDPDTKEGRQYWDEVYARAQELFGENDISIPTATRPWIVPGEIILRRGADSAYIYKATLNVMLEQDYLGAAAVGFNDPRLVSLNEYSSELIRSLVIPKLVREVNSSKKYAQLRQVYYCLILAQWFKASCNRLSSADPLVRTIDQRDMTGLASSKQWSKDTYFKAYRKSFSQGEYKKEETVSGMNGLTVRTYVSGGIEFNASSIIGKAGVNGMVIAAQQEVSAEHVKRLTRFNTKTGEVALAQSQDSQAAAIRDGGMSGDIGGDITLMQKQAEAPQYSRLQKAMQEKRRDFYENGVAGVILGVFGSLAMSLAFIVPFMSFTYCCFAASGIGFWCLAAYCIRVSYKPYKAKYDEFRAYEAEHGIRTQAGVNSPSGRDGGFSGKNSPVADFLRVEKIGALKEYLTTDEWREEILYEARSLRNHRRLTGTGLGIVFAISFAGVVLGQWLLAGVAAFTGIVAVIVRSSTGMVFSSTAARYANPVSRLARQFDLAYATGEQNDRMVDEYFRAFKNAVESGYYLSRHGISVQRLMETDFAARRKMLGWNPPDFSLEQKIYSPLSGKDGGDDSDTATGEGAALSVSEKFFLLDAAEAQKISRISFFGVMMPVFVSTAIMLSAGFLALSRSGIMDSIAADKANMFLGLSIGVGIPVSLVIAFLAARSARDKLIEEAFGKITPAAEIHPAALKDGGETVVPVDLIDIGQKLEEMRTDGWKDIQQQRVAEQYGLVRTLKYLTAVSLVISIATCLFAPNLMLFGFALPGASLIAWLLAETGSFTDHHSVLSDEIALWLKQLKMRQGISAEYAIPPMQQKKMNEYLASLPVDIQTKAHEVIAEYFSIYRKAVESGYFREKYGKLVNQWMAEDYQFKYTVYYSQEPQLNPVWSRDGGEAVQPLTKEYFSTDQWRTSQMERVLEWHRKNRYLRLLGVGALAGGAISSAYVALTASVSMACFGVPILLGGGIVLSVMSFLMVFERKKADPLPSYIQAWIRRVVGDPYLPLKITMANIDNFILNEPELSLRHTVFLALVNYEIIVVPGAGQKRSLSADISPAVSETIGNYFAASQACLDEGWYRARFGSKIQKMMELDLRLKREYMDTKGVYPGNYSIHVPFADKESIKSQADSVAAETRRIFDREKARLLFFYDGGTAQRTWTTRLADAFVDIYSRDPWPGVVFTAVLFGSMISSALTSSAMPFVAGILGMGALHFTFVYLKGNKLDREREELHQSVMRKEGKDGGLSDIKTRRRIAWLGGAIPAGIISGETAIFLITRFLWPLIINLNTYDLVEAYMLGLSGLAGVALGLAVAFAVGISLENNWAMPRLTPEQTKAVLDMTFPSDPDEVRAAFQKKDGGDIDVSKWIKAKVTMDDLNKDMFRDYDYRRTKLGPEVTPAVMFRFGLAWAKMALEKAKAAGITNRDVIVARDARKIEADLPQALIDAFRYAGLNVKYAAAHGPNAVTSYSWAIQAYRPLMSLFITASHVSEPKENQVRGFKVAMMKEIGGAVQSITTREIKKESYEIITDLIEHPEKIADLEAGVSGTCETVEVDEDCIRFNTMIGQAAAARVSLFDLARRVNSPDIFEVLEREEKKYKGARPLTGVSIVVEGFNTPSGKLGYETFSNLGATVSPLHLDVVEVDGEHNADPAKDTNLAQLKQEIEDKHAVFGIAFDLDGDRGAIVVPERDENGKVVGFTTLTPDNLIVALLDYLINTWGYKKEITGRKVAAIRDVLGTFAVNEQTTAAGGDPFQTDAGYVFLKALREKLLADNYSVPIYGERSGHCWLDITGEIENPVAVAVLFAIMAKQEQYNQNNHPKTNNPFLQAYKDKIIPYAQAPRFSAPFDPAFLKILSDRQDAKQRSDWTFEDKPQNPPQRIIADGRDRIARALEKEFVAGKTFHTPAGPLVVRSFDAKEDEDDGKYRFADIHFALPDGTFAGRYVFRASANEPVFVMTYEAKVHDNAEQAAQEYEAAIGGLIIEWLQKNKYALFTREAIREVFNDDTKFDKWDLKLPLDHLNAFKKWRGVKDGGQAAEADHSVMKISLKSEVARIIADKEGLEKWKCKHDAEYGPEYMEKAYKEHLEHITERSVQDLVALGETVIPGLKKFVSMPMPMHKSESARNSFLFAQECARRALVQLHEKTMAKDGGDGIFGYHDPQALGGIDFRALPVATQPALVMAAVAQPALSVQALDSQWNRIRQQLSEGKTPYGDLTKYIAMCCNRDDSQQRRHEVLECVMNILKMEEERALATPVELKELLCALG